MQTTARLYGMVYKGKFVHPTDAKKLYTLRQVMENSAEFLFKSEADAREARKNFPEIMQFVPEIKKLTVSVSIVTTRKVPPRRKREPICY